MNGRNLLLLSSSTLHGSGYLEYARDQISQFFKGVQEILFVPYANVMSYEDYTKKVRAEFGKMGISVQGLHEAPNPVAAINLAQGIFVGGGNTFHLLKVLQEKQLLEPIKTRVLQNGVPYLGSSAGTNIATISINTTNDMPIVHCSSFQALGLVPFNINPHYLDSDEKSTHMGETRETRIQEYHALPSPAPAVLGLREGSWLSVKGDTAKLGGTTPARLFVQGKGPAEYQPGSDLSFLLQQ